MRRCLQRFVVGFGLIALSAVPASADHNSLVAADSDPSAPSISDRSSADRSSLDVDLKLGLNGFRLGARIFGNQGYTGGAWLNGETRPEGFSVDGRVERDGGKSWNFKLNADIDEALRRAAGWWGALRSQ